MDKGIEFIGNTTIEYKGINTYITHHSPAVMSHTTLGKTLKSLNLISLSDALMSDISDIYFAYTGIKPKPYEAVTLLKLCQTLQSLELPTNKFSDFFFGYEIPHLGKEFDLLKIGNNYNLNIELKTVANETKIVEQLRSNKLYLSSLEKPAKLYSYIMDTDTFYTLDANDLLTEVSSEDVKQAIMYQDGINVGDLNTLFDPAKYLVSPFNATDSFIRNQYLLTPQQYNIVQELNKIFESSTGNIISINGEAGTGKSLVLYHYAKQIIQRGNKALIVHVAQLNSGHIRLMRECGLSISAIYTFMSYLKSQILNNFDVIIFDEAQRLRNDQIEQIIEYVKNNRINCIFGYDEKQKLSDEELRSTSVQLIKDNSTLKHTLSRCIRSNNTISSFTRSLFNLTVPYKEDPTPISVIYFKEHKHLIEYLNNDTEFNLIYYTPSRYYINEYVNSLANTKTSIGAAHEVIGQEFNNVSVVINETFYYDQSKKLKSTGYKNIPYDFTGMLHQAVTRARKKLKIIIINNPNVYNKITTLLLE